MKKTLIASAVAAATLSSTAFAMDPATQLAERLDSMPEFYGNIQLAWANQETETSGVESSTNELQDNGSTFGIKHDHAITEDITGFLKAEFHFDGDDSSTDSGLGENMDEAYIGIKGDFGSVQLGSDDTVYEWVDVMDMYEFAGLEGDLAFQKEGDNLQYYSPELADGLTLGVTLPIDSDSNFGGALAAKYAIDNMEFVLAYGMGREETADIGDSIGFAATVGLEDLTLSFQYETKSEDGNSDNGTDYFGLMGQYAMGANNFALGYQMKSFDASGAEDESGIYVQALHNLSDHMYIYLEYLTRSDVGGVENDESDTLALGATYAF